MTEASTRPRKSYPKGVERRREILDAAMEMVMETGGANLSMRELARRSGLSQSGLLHYFADSTAVLTAVIEEKESVLEGLTSRLKGDPAAQMRAVENYDAEHGGIAEMFTILAGEAVAADHPANQYFIRRYARVMIETDAALRGMQAEGAVRADLPSADLSALLIAVLDGLRLLKLYSPSVDSRAALASFWKLLEADGAAE